MKLFKLTKFISKGIFLGHVCVYALIFTLAAYSGKLNVMVWRPSVCPFVCPFGIFIVTG